MGAMLGEGMVKLGQVVLAEGMRAKLGDIRKCNLLLVFEKMSLRTKTRHLQNCHDEISHLEIYRGTKYGYLEQHFKTTKF